MCMALPINYIFELVYEISPNVEMTQEVNS